MDIALLSEVGFFQLVVEDGIRWEMGMGEEGREAGGREGRSSKRREVDMEVEMERERQREKEREEDVEVLE